uniref:Uncharacterized protein n=1 Tax=Romanomermis culicivorax TaxID=13658 RepID=A0A915JUV0_ROMCU
MLKQTLPLVGPLYEHFRLALLYLFARLRRRRL